MNWKTQAKNYITCPTIETCFNGFGTRFYDAKKIKRRQQLKSEILDWGSKTIWHNLPVPVFFFFKNHSTLISLDPAYSGPVCH